MGPLPDPTTTSKAVAATGTASFMDHQHDEEEGEDESIKKKDHDLATMMTSSSTTMMEILPIYSERCQALLQQALLIVVPASSLSVVARNSRGNNKSSSQSGVLSTTSTSRTNSIVINKNTSLFSRYASSSSEESEGDDHNNPPTGARENNKTNETSQHPTTTLSSPSASSSSDQDEEQDEEEVINGSQHQSLSDDLIADLQLSLDMEQQLSTNLDIALVQPLTMTKNRSVMSVSGQQQQPYLVSSYNNNSRKHGDGTKPKRNRGSSTNKNDSKQQEQFIRKTFLTMSCIRLSLPNQMTKATTTTTNTNTAATVLDIPAVLWSKEDRRRTWSDNDSMYSDSSIITTTTTNLASNLTLPHHPQQQQQTQQQKYYAQSALQLSKQLGQGLVVVLSLRSGRFAAAVFRANTCIVHRTSQRYTTRRGQGKAQSSQDDKGHKAKSMGAQLRRAGEINLQNDVQSTLVEWKSYLQQALLIYIAAPKTMWRTFFDIPTRTQMELGDQWIRTNPRIRRVPLDLGRPTYEQVCYIHSIMMTVGVVQIPILSNIVQVKDGDACSSEASLIHTTTTATVVEDNNETDPVIEPSFPPLTELHLAAMNGNKEDILNLLQARSSSTSPGGDKNEEENENVESIVVTPAVTDAAINTLAGEDWMTPLHMAAQSTTIYPQTTTSIGGDQDAAAAAARMTVVDATVAADIVLLLLERGHANPCIVDQRGRPPYYLSSHDKVRDAFRRARAILGEDYCAWDEQAKVGPPLSDDVLQARKEKELEKKKKKRARQKDKKAMENKRNAEMEAKQRAEEERQKQLEEAKRIRDGLIPKKVNSTIGNVCDYCHQVCTGRKRNQMLNRLDYVYCSTECVQEHKRELMAKAAMSRLANTTNPVNIS